MKRVKPKTPHGMICAYIQTRCTYAMHKKKKNWNYAAYCLIHCRPFFSLTFHISFLNYIHHHYRARIVVIISLKIKNARDPLLLIFFFSLFCIASCSSIRPLTLSPSHFATAVDSIWKTQPNCCCSSQAREKKCDAEKRLHPLFIQY